MNILSCTNPDHPVGLVQGGMIIGSRLPLIRHPLLLLATNKMYHEANNRKAPGAAVNGPGAWTPVKEATWVSLAIRPTRGEISC